MTQTSLEKERIKHVNTLTNELHDSCDEIYESLIDHDYGQCKEVAKHLIFQLKLMIDSMEDDL
jgi:glutamine synthetase type III